METHQILNGKVQLLQARRQPDLRAASVGVSSDAPRRSDMVFSLATEFAEDWHLELRGKHREAYNLLIRRGAIQASSILREWQIITV